MVKGGEIGGFEGGKLKPQQWLGAQRIRLFLEVPSCPEPPAAPRGGAGGELWHCQGNILTMLRHRLTALGDDARELGL